MDIDEILLGTGFLSFAYIGWRALKIYGTFFFHVLTQPLAEDSKGNNLGQMIAMLTFAMLSLALSALVSLSVIKITFVLGFMLSGFFALIAAAIAIVWFFPQLSVMTESKISPESSPLLWSSITVLSLLALSSVYLDRILLSSFGANTDAGHIFSLLSFDLGACVILALLGKELIKSHGFLSRLLSGELYASGLYAVVCPCLGLYFLGHFLINVGLVQTSLLEAWNFYYWLFHLPLIALQAYVIRLFFRLNAKLFPKAQAPHTRPASQK